MFVETKPYFGNTFPFKLVNFQRYLTNVMPLKFHFEVYYF